MVAAKRRKLKPKAKAAKKARTRPAKKQIRVVVEGAGDVNVPVGTTPLEILKKKHVDTEFPVIAAKYNNKVRELKSPLERAGRLEFVTIGAADGMSVYRRSITFVMTRAARELFKDPKVYVRHSLSKGYYCEIDLGRHFETGDMENLESRMREIVSADEPFVRQEVSVEEALDIFERDAQMDKVGVLAIFLLALIPNPVIDVGGMIAGTKQMPVLHFLLAGWAGKAIRFTLLALSGQFLLGC